MTLFIKGALNMGKVLFSLSVLFLTLFMLRCAGTQKPDPELVAVCKSGCDTNYDGCVKKAVKNQAKKAACEAVKNKCTGDCEINPENPQVKKKKTSSK